MPLPEKKNESTKEFITRCMGDEVMKREYADADQRYAVCVRLSEDAEHNTTYEQFFGEAGYREHEETFDLETKDIPEVEIMSPGIWNGIKFTRADLLEVANNFKKLKGRLTPKLTLGHVSEKETARLASLPSIGYVKNLWYDEKVQKLKGYFASIPKKLHDLMKASGFPDVSATYWRHYYDSVSGKYYNRVMAYCGIVGAGQPAVTTNKTLDQAIANYIHKGNLETLDAATPEGATIEVINHKDETLTQTQRGGDKVDDLEIMKEAKATADKALKRAEEFIQKVCEKFDDCSRDELLSAIDAAVKDRDDFKSKIEDMETNARKEKADALFTEVSGKLLPKEEENYRTVLMSSEDFDAKLTELRELFTEKKLILKKDEQAEHDPTGGKGEDFSKKPKATEESEESEEFNAEEFVEDIGRELDEKGIGDTLSDESKEEFTKKHGRQEKTG